MAGSQSNEQEAHTPISIAAKVVEGDLTGKSHGKTVLKQLRTDFRAKYSVELQVITPGEHIAVRELQTIANKAFKRQEQLS